MKKIRDEAAALTFLCLAVVLATVGSYLVASLYHLMK